MSTFNNAAFSHGPFSAGAQAMDTQFRVEPVRLVPSLPFRVVKRVVDIVVSLVVLVALTLPAAVIALLITRESEGPVFSRRAVAGKNGSFIMYTFRTTYDPAWDTTESHQTRMGSFLCTTGLFIIPQFVNVLLGDMSLVGPRPLHASSHQISGFTCRLAMRPGMTGLAQIKGADDLSLTEELAYDRTYIATSSLSTDTRVIAMTLTQAFAA